MTPTTSSHARPRRLPGPASPVPQAPLCYRVFPSKLGWICVVWDGDKVSRVVMGRPSPGVAVNDAQRDASELFPDRGLVESDAPSHIELESRLRNFASGGAECFLDVTLDDEGLTQFQRRVTGCCRQVARGETRTYMQLAADAGSPNAARAVGNCMAKNRWPLIVPCHRIVAAGGRLGGFSAPDGPDLKRRLLNAENGRAS